MLDAFIEHALEQDIELYPAQEEAVLELVSGNNVILNTPTGSGKSLVAVAAHFAALAADKRSFYTAPIKALVSEKFFSLVREFGPERVGMITGDASVNADAPIIACTAEIVANLALRDGAEADIDMVIMDEFHYYADPQRGWAWQVPLLELPQAQFLLMSATLGATDRFEAELTERTGRQTTLVKSTVRPVPLTFEYRDTTLHDSIEELIDSGRAPVYVVHFTQREATEAAQAFTSIDVLTKEEKSQVAELMGGFRFDSPIGKDLKRFLSHGIGVHHAGLLPKYRLLVEKLAQAGLLKLISGTDTLGVGVNVPIRSVLFTQLCKYDGRSTRVLSVREFQQIAGRAGRKGFDTEGHVWVQAPAHVVENLRAVEKLENSKKKKKLVKKKPPERGYSHWNEDTFTKLTTAEPEPLTSSFDVSHGMLLNVLDRPGDGCGAMRTILLENHETHRRQRRHIRRAIGIYRSLLDSEVIERLDTPDDLGRLVRVTIDLQDNFALNQPLSLFALEAIDALDVDADGYALDVLSVLESVLENPGVIIAAQLDLLRGETIGRLKSEGMEYDDRMEELDKLEHPKPLADFLFPAFDIFRGHHPWVGGDTIRPKSVARDLYERAMTFSEFVNHYKLKRSEGVVLRYFSDCFKALVQNVPEDAKTEELYDLTEWLGALVRQVDSSLIDEWEKMRNPDPVADEPEPPELDGPPDVTRNERAFAVMVRNEAFRWVQLLSRKRHHDLVEYAPDHSPEELKETMAPYWEAFDEIRTGADARARELFNYDRSTGQVRQVLADPEMFHEWHLAGHVDLDASREQGRAVVYLDRIVSVQ